MITKTLSKTNLKSIRGIFPHLVITRESLHMYYKSECLLAIIYIFIYMPTSEQVFMNAMKLFMARLGCITFIQRESYGKF